MSDQTIDREALERLLGMIGGDGDDLRELIQDFRDEAPTMVAEIRHKSDTRDAEAIRIAAHSLKSNSRDLGATALAHRAEAVERAMKEGADSVPPSEVEAIERDLASALEALSSIAVTYE